MNSYPYSQVTGTGHCVPDKLVTNKDLEKIIDTSDEWITSRTGIKQRYVAPEGVLNSDISSEASKIAMKDAGVKPEDIDAIILGTISGDVGFPATACYVQEKIGAINATAFDISAACSGFLYGLNIANGFIATGLHKTILVIGAETLSRILNWEDRNTCILFGDGAGAAIVQPSDGKKGILAEYMKSDGRLANLLMNPGHNTGKDYISQSGDVIGPHIFMEGKDVFKHAVKSMYDAVLKVMEKTDLTFDDIDLLIPHQANTRIIDMVCQKSKFPRDRVFVNVDRFGNTSAGSIPIALDEAKKSGRIKDGMKVLLPVFGGGFTWGAVIMQF